MVPRRTIGIGSGARRHQKLTASVELLLQKMDATEKGQTEDMQPGFPIDSRLAWDDFSEALSRLVVRRQFVGLQKFLY